MSGDRGAPSPFFGDYPDGAYWSAEPASATDGQSFAEADHHVVRGTVIRLMWDYGVVVPLWDAEGLLPEEPQWLRTVLQLGDDLIEALRSWGLEMNRLDGGEHGLTAAQRATAYDEANERGRGLARWLQRELGARFEVRYEPW